MRQVSVETTWDGLLFKDDSTGKPILSFDLHEAWALQDFLKAASIISANQRNELDLRMTLAADKSGKWLPAA